MDQFLVLMQQIDLPYLVVMAGFFWIFNGVMNKKFEKIDKKFESIDRRFEKIDAEFKEVRNEIKEVKDELKKEIQDLRTSVNRIEGMLFHKECCILHSNEKKKVE